ncbi:MAG: hypothetical protein QNJ47_15010 [Nostocaceae cyanobacterium]|nr:hypothetical protein [Nostocaceae cyanobacterium]
MKKLILATLPLLFIASSAIDPANAAANFRRDTKATYIVRSGAIPNNINDVDATHYFELQVQGNPLSQLFIDIPEGIKVSKGIRVTDESGQKVAAEVTIADKTATINFSQPVDSKKIRIALRGVSNTYPHFGYSRTWLYSVSGRHVGFTADIPYGLVQVQTYGGG